jgi:hypothetical protein
MSLEPDDLTHPDSRTEANPRCVELVHREQ